MILIAAGWSSVYYTPVYVRQREGYRSVPKHQLLPLTTLTATHIIEVQYCATEKYNSPSEEFALEGILACIEKKTVSSGRTGAAHQP